jgi:hypothetical protein
MLPVRRQSNPYKLLEFVVRFGEHLQERIFGDFQGTSELPACQSHWPSKKQTKLPKACVLAALLGRLQHDRPLTTGCLGTWVLLLVLSEVEYNDLVPRLAKDPDRK